MSVRSSKSGSSRAFTLIELLVVIAIVAILAGLMFPAFGSVKNSSRKVQAKTDLMNLVVATRAYYTEYGKYPVGPTQAGLQWNTVFGDPDGLYSSADLCNTLRAISDDKLNVDNQLNPRQTVFLQGKSVSDPANPRSGFATQTAKGTAGTIKKGAFVDPWGAEYCVFVDASYRNNVSHDGGLEWFYYSEHPTVMQDVVGVSLGTDSAWGTKADGKFTGSDDIATW